MDGSDVFRTSWVGTSTVSRLLPLGIMMSKVLMDSEFLPRVHWDGRSQFFRDFMNCKEFTSLRFLTSRNLNTRTSKALPPCMILWLRSALIWRLFLYWDFSNREFAMQRLHSSWSFKLPVSKTPMSLDPYHAFSSTMDGPDSFFVLGLRESSSLRTRISLMHLLLDSMAIGYLCEIWWL